MPGPSDLPPLYTFRHQRVVLDSDLAALYGASTTAFNQAVRRNLKRFPPDFVFAVSPQERSRLISQNVTSNDRPACSRTGRGGRRKPSLAFTEHGAIMAAMILRRPRAVAMSVYVVRAFVQMREALFANATILKRLAEMDRKLVTHDVILRDVFEKLRPLLAPPPPAPRRAMGFHVHLGKP